jgi:hypothetical protein
LYKEKERRTPMKRMIVTLMGMFVGGIMIAASPALSFEQDRNSYFVFKGGGWSLQEKDIKDAKTGTYWEIAYGGKFNPYIGAELGLGYMSTEGKLFFTTAKVQTIPLNLSLRLGIPIAIVEPYVLLGGGLYVSMIEVGPASTTIANFGYQGGLGVDLNLGAFVVGLEGRYFVMKGEVLGTTVDLDGSTLALKAGFRF